MKSEYYISLNLGRIQCGSYSRWRWLAFVKAIRRVIIWRFFLHHLELNKPCPGWFRILEGGW